MYRKSMVEVSPGTGVFTYEHNLSAALQKKSATFAATFLLNFLNSKVELLEHGYTGLDRQVLASIIGKNKKLFQFDELLAKEIIFFTEKEQV